MWFFALIYIIVGLVRESYLEFVAASDLDGWRSASATDSCPRTTNGGGVRTGRWN